MRAMTSSACRAPNSVRAASSGVLPPISGCGVVRKRLACSRSCQTSSAIALTRAKRSVRSLSAGLRRSRRRLYVASGTMRCIMARCSEVSEKTRRATLRRVALGKPRSTASFNSSKDVTGLPNTRRPPRTSPIWRGSSMSIIIPHVLDQMILASESTPIRAATVRERWISVWPANAPLRSRLGLGLQVRSLILKPARRRVAAVRAYRGTGLLEALFGAGHGAGGHIGEHAGPLDLEDDGRAAGDGFELAPQGLHGVHH